jgi:hypothetical protein
MATNNAANNATAASGKVLQGQGVGTASAFSTATYPATATSTGTMLRADGTNWSPTTATYPGTATSTGTVLRADGTNWTPTTATYPNTATSTGTVLRADGTNWSPSTATYPGTTTANQVLYSSATNTVGEITTAANGVLVTSAGSVPSISSTLPTAVQGNITSTGNLGNQLNTTRSCVLAYVSSNINNVTGDATVYTIIFDSTKFDQNSNFNTSTGVFTAPVTGRYLVTTFVTLGSLSALHTGLTFVLVTTTTNYGLVQSLNPGVIRDTGNNLTVTSSIVVPLSATNTAQLNMGVSGSTKTVGILGNASPFSTFSITLLC